MNHYTRALALAQTSAYPEPSKRMAALVIRGGALLNAETNRLPGGGYPGRANGRGHAEHRALRPHKDFRGATIVVARANGGCSRPCERCVESLRASGIHRMVYIDSFGALKKERV